MIKTEIHTPPTTEVTYKQLLKKHKRLRKKDDKLAVKYDKMHLKLDKLESKRDKCREKLDRLDNLIADHGEADQQRPGQSPLPAAKVPKKKKIA
jgi:uncharacterized coiled-coil DUF342 family protein